MIPQRMNNGMFYWEISRINYAEYTRLISMRIREKSDEDCGSYIMVLRDEKDRRNDSNSSVLENLIEFECLIKKAGIISIVFAAMYLESEAYTYLAHHFTDSFVNDHLDKLTPLSKWVAGVKMVTGESMNKGDIVYQSCDKLFKYRNKLVHNKSTRFVTDQDALFELIDARDKRFEEEVVNSQRAVRELARYISQLHSENYVPVLNI